ncbi:MAG: DinB family protein [Acidobacteria bacterium]|nr:DinB family protein [Acidobacteriota bacterium]
MITAALVLTSLGAATAATLTEIERQHLLAHMQMTEQWLADEISHLSPAQLTFKPSPQSWSILEVVEHLMVVGPIYWQDLQAALKSPPRERASSWSDADILWYGIDRTRGDGAIPSEVPARKLRDVKVGLDAIRRAHAQLGEYIKTTQDDLRRHIVARQGCDAYQWALMISTHEQRHILQIREIKRARGSPR